MSQSDHIFLRGKVYWCWYYSPSGRCIRRTTKCRDKRAALAALARFERSAQGSNGAAQDAPPWSVHEAVDYFLEHVTGIAPQTLRMYSEKGNHVFRLLGQLDVNALDMVSIRGYIKRRDTEGAAPETIRKELTTLRQALVMAHEEHRFLGDPKAIFPKFQVTYKPRDRYLTQDEFRKLVAELQPHRRLWLVVAVYTGGRDSEVDGLKWEHLDWATHQLLLPGTKTEKSRRWVPLHPLLSQVLGAIRQRSGVIVGEWMNVRRDLHAACARAGIPPVSPNDLRRTYASWLKQGGADSAAVAKLMGHTSTKMVDLVYGRIDAATLTRTVNLLPGGNCEAGRQNKNAAAGTMGPVGKDETLENTVSLVLGPRVELGTRGFSVRTSSYPDTRIINLNSHRRKKL